MLLLRTGVKFIGGESGSGDVPSMDDLLNEDEPKGDESVIDELGKDDASDKSKTKTPADSTKTEDGKESKEDKGGEGSTEKKKEVDSTKPKGEAKTDDVVEDDEPVVIKIGKDEYKVDKDGNVLDKEGKVAFTKEQVAELEKEETTTAKIGELEVKDIIENIGFEILNEEGKPKTYENTAAGIVEYAKDLAGKFVVENQEAFLNSVPGLREYAMAMQMPNMTQEKFFSLYVTEDFVNTAITDTTPEDVLKNIIIKDLVKKGVDPDAAAEVANAAKTNGTLKDKAIASQTSIKAAKDADIAKLAAEHEKAVKANEKAIKEHTESTIATIKSGKIGDVVIRVADQQPLIDYLLKPVNDQGETQELLDLKKRTPTERLIQAYHRFKGYNPEAAAKAKREQLGQKATKYEGLVSKLIKASQGDGKSKGRSKDSSSVKGKGAAAEDENLLSIMDTDGQVY